MSRGGSARYFAAQALASVRASPYLSLLTAGTIATTLLVLGTFAVGLQNLEGLALVWGRSATLTAYIEDTVPPSGWPALHARVQELEPVGHAELVTPRQALERFRARGPQAAALVEGVDEDVLPAQIDVDLRAGFADLAKVHDVAQSLDAIEGIAAVDYGREEFERLRALLGLVRSAGIAVGALLLLATALIVANTIRLTVYARRDEIGILRLVGATGAFVRTPFLLEGGLWGLCGGLVSAAVLATADATLAPRVTEAIAGVLGGLDIRLFALDVGLGMVALGVVLGVGGSALAVRRFLEDEPE